MIEWKKTERGFERGEFKDLYEKECSIQESSLADVAAIWLGVDKGIPVHLGGSGEAVHQRMHLTRNQAREIGEALLLFAEEGRIRPL